MGVEHEWVATTTVAMPRLFDASRHGDCGRGHGGNVETGAAMAMEARERMASDNSGDNGLKAATMATVRRGW